jgi:hypothetical protein
MIIIMQLYMDEILYQLAELTLPLPANERCGSWYIEPQQVRVIA